MIMPFRKTVFILFITLQAACMSSCKTGFMADDNLMQCVNNMRQIETAKRTFVMGYSIENGVLLTQEQIDEMASFMPGRTLANHRCASGGIYNIGRTGQPPSCSVHGNLDDIRTYFK